jgi:hypothetical protein
MKVKVTAVLYVDLSHWDNPDLALAKQLVELELDQIQEMQSMDGYAVLSATECKET